MGNICGHHKRLRWNERQIIQSWVPLLMNMFTYDNTGTISGLNSSYFAQDFHAANDQLRTLPILLKGRSGIDKTLLRKIKSLQQQTSTLLGPNGQGAPTNTQNPAIPQQYNHATKNLDTSFLPNGGGAEEQVA